MQERQGHAHRNARLPPLLKLKATQLFPRVALAHWEQTPTTSAAAVIIIDTPTNTCQDILVQKRRQALETYVLGTSTMMPGTRSRQLVDSGCA